MWTASVGLPGYFGESMKSLRAGKRSQEGEIGGFGLSERKSDMEAYCVKCRDRRELKDPKPVTLSNGRPAIQGTCPVCATKLTRIVKAGEKSLQS